ncbi:ferric reductase like transmembrane component [Tothia fuscella]|uniref:Ferric reductase like transmembrane component n=1 Tax=Tothia fuscella TaxID=1048955 RepID=A0A9P4U3B4_9PEZI|nr:ferric reductase like transmembrane component [Tothia fuscella]
MFSKSLFFAPVWMNAVAVMASTGRPGHGLIGYGINMYSPTCATACRDVISPSSLNCTEMESGSGHGGMMMMHGASATSPECYATDDVFLQSLAWCISTHCTGKNSVPLWKLERWWKTSVVGKAAIQPDPKESYEKTLSRVTKPPTEILVSKDPLNKTSLVPEDSYTASFNADTIFEKQESLHSRYGIVLLVTGAAIPIALSLLRFVPWPAHMITKFNALFIYPPAFGSRHNSPIAGMANMPTRGQALFIGYLILINIVLTFANIGTVTPNAWYDTTKAQYSSYISNRTGVLSFANIPLLILYASRNNVLLWVTNWSHSTFLLLHRWVAWICTIQAVVHSILYLQDRVALGTHTAEAKTPYWIWGIVATLGMCILLPTSILPLRKKFYELFLVWHVVVSVLVVAGCYLHIIYRFEHQWGYEAWIFAAFAVWGFERIMRVLRVARNGVRTATITKIDEEYIRVDVPGVSGDGHAYLYFPTLTWRVWENHPFSVASTVLQAPRSSPSSVHKEDLSLDVEKNGIHRSSMSKVSDLADSNSERSAQRQPTKVGLTFLLRVQGGLTNQLKSRATIPVLVESGYGTHEDLSSNSLLIGIAGGVGITAVLPVLHSHPGRTKLFWGARTHGIIDEMQSTLAGVDKETFVGNRMNVYDVLAQELTGSSENVVVVSSGPSGMADEVRMAVCKLGKKSKGSITLVEEAFSW